MKLDSDGVKELLNEKGEIIVTMDSGERFELHKWDVSFDEFGDGVMEWDTGDQQFMLDAEAVESVEVHASHKIE